MDDLRKKLLDTRNVILKYTDFSPEIGLILGSGLGVLAEEIEKAIALPFSELPHFPVSTVAGHAGRLVMGELAGMSVIAMQGRFHYYEGYQMDQVSYPVRLMQLMGVKKLIVTNAAGGIGDHLLPGDLMLIEDHINLMGNNPLIGENNHDFGPRFPDMSEAYSEEMRRLAFQAAEEMGLSLKSGVYAALTGPSYETPAEIKYLKLIGAAAVGMSTVPEVIAANHGGMQVLGLSCITNMAAGISSGRLSHEEVTATADKTVAKFAALLKGILARLETNETI